MKLEGVLSEFGADMKRERSEVGGVGKYLKAAAAEGGKLAVDGGIDDLQDKEESAKKEVEGGGLGDFSAW